jgi:hypothetical protein
VFQDVLEVRERDEAREVVISDGLGARLAEQLLGHIVNGLFPGLKATEREFKEGATQVTEVFEKAFDGARGEVEKVTKFIDEIDALL